MNLADKAVLAGLLATAPLSGASAQTAAPALPVLAPLAVPNPRYATLAVEVIVNKPAAEVWAKVGKYCDIAIWFDGFACAITSGKEGDLGSVRVLNGRTIEILVAKTDLSYTYMQPVRQGVLFNAYHGTLEAKPLTATTSKVIYSMVWDESLLADDAARADFKAGRIARLTPALQKLKAVAEAN